MKTLGTVAPLHPTVNPSMYIDYMKKVATFEGGIVKTQEKDDQNESTLCQSLIFCMMLTVAACYRLDLLYR